MKRTSAVIKKAMKGTKEEKAFKRLKSIDFDSAFIYEIKQKLDQFALFANLRVNRAAKKETIHVAHHFMLKWDRMANGTIQILMALVISRVGS